MKTNFKETQEKVDIEIGDVIVTYNSCKYLIIETEHPAFRYTAIDVESMSAFNSYNSLEEMLKSLRGRIKRIVKHENLEIREVE